MKGKIPQITFTSDYFRKTVRNESLYPLVWRVVKEVVQNSRDAGASELIINCYDDEKAIEFIDNAGGMDEDTLLNIFLALGGSKKDKDIEGGSIGGFGDAKKVILLCWDKWMVHTQDNLLTSEMLGNEPIKKVEYFHGTRIKVWMENEYEVNGVINYINLCQLDTIDIHVYRGTNDDNKIPVETSKLYRRRLTRDLGFGKLYINKSNHSGLMVVRLNGLALFDKPVFGMKATAILELENTTDPKSDNYMLNVTREGLKWNYDSVVQGVIDEIISEPTKALKPKKTEYIERHRGTGKVKTLLPNNSNSGIKLVDVLKNIMNSNPDMVQYTLGELNLIEDEVMSSNVVLKSNGCANVEEYAKMVLSHDSFSDLVELAVHNNDSKRKSELVASNRLEFDVSEFNDEDGLSSVYPYDFIIKGKTSIKYNTLKYQKILLAWHKLIEYICFYNNINNKHIDLGEYQIGFVFDPDVKAQYLVMKGEKYILLNPSDLSFSDYGRKGLVMELLTRAVHEITHEFYEHHDGNFIAKEASIRSTCYMYLDEIMPVINGILKSKKDNLKENAMLDEEYIFD